MALLDTLGATGGASVGELARWAQALTRATYGNKAAEAWNPDIQAWDALTKGHPVAASIGRAMPYAALPIKGPVTIQGPAVGALSEYLGSGGKTTPEDVGASAVMGLLGAGVPKLGAKAVAPGARAVSSGVKQLWNKARDAGFKLPPGEAVSALKKWDSTFLHHPLNAGKTAEGVYLHNSNKLLNEVTGWLDPQFKGKPLTRETVAQMRAKIVKPLWDRARQSAKRVTLSNKEVELLHSMGIPTAQKLKGGDAMSLLRDISRASVSGGEATPALRQLYDRIEKAAFPSDKASKVFNEAKVKFRAINALEGILNQGKSINPETGVVTNASPLAQALHDLVSSPSAAKYIPEQTKLAVKAATAFPEYFSSVTNRTHSISSTAQTAGLGGMLGGGLGGYLLGGAPGALLGGSLGMALPFITPKVIYPSYMSRGAVNYLTRQIPPGVLNALERGSAAAMTVPSGR